jgi:predicted kinase
MPKFVILRGKPTSGKSTAFRNLKKKKEMKDWIFIDHPIIKRMVENLKDHKEVSKKLLFGMVKKAIKTKKNIIMEETSRSTLKKYTGNYIKKYNYKVIVFQFTILKKSAYKRDIQRVKEKECIHIKELGKDFIDYIHEYHDKNFDPTGILIDTNKLGKRQVVNIILENIKLK